MDTNLIKNIITGGQKTLTVTEAGAWYRLGYVEKNSNFYGEFLITHNWNNNVPAFVKLLVAGGCVDTPSFYKKEVVQTHYGCGTGNATYIKGKMIKKARIVSYHGGSSNYNIYVDVFIQNTGWYVAKSDNWIYKLSNELNPFGLKWVDCAFGEATVPSGYGVQEFSFT